MGIIKIVHVPCSKTNHHIYSNSCAIIRYSNIQTCGKPPNMFGLLWSSSRKHATKKNAIMLVISYMCNNEVNIQILVLLKRLKSTIQSVCHSNYWLQTNIYCQNSCSFSGIYPCISYGSHSFVVLICSWTYVPYSVPKWLHIWR